MGSLLDLVKRETQELTPEKERRLWQRARVPYPLEEVNAAVADGIVYTGTDDIATRSTAIGSRRGLELWRHLHAWYKGIGPELVQRTVADLLTPERVQSPADLQPALISLKEQIREVTTAGHPLDDTQKEIALKGLLPKALLDRLDDLEETHTDFELKLRWVER